MYLKHYFLESSHASRRPVLVCSYHTCLKVRLPPASSPIANSPIIIIMAPHSRNINLVGSFPSLHRYKRLKDFPSTPAIASAICPIRKRTEGRRRGTSPHSSNNQLLLTRYFVILLAHGRQNEKKKQIPFYGNSYQPV